MISEVVKRSLEVGVAVVKSAYLDEQEKLLPPPRLDKKLLSSIIYVKLFQQYKDCSVKFIGTRRYR